MNTVRAHIDDRAKKMGEACFLISPEIGSELSFGSLQKSADQIEIYLTKLGVKFGDKVAFLMTNGLWTTTLFLGAMYSGRVVVPLNAVCGSDQLTYVIDHCDAKVLFVERELQEKYKVVFDGLANDIEVIFACRNNGPI